MINCILRTEKFAKLLYNISPPLWQGVLDTFLTVEEIGDERNVVLDKNTMDWTSE